MSEAMVDKCMERLDVVYPGHFRRPGINADFALQVYHEILDDVDDSLLMAATKQWLSTAHPFHPSPGELRDLALTLTEHDEPSADEAWSEVFDAVRKVGSYGVPAWSNERIAKTMQAFGRWSDFCLTETDQLGVIRAQFLRIYEAQTKRQHDDRLMMPETRDIVAQRIAKVVEQKRIGLYC